MVNFFYIWLYRDVSDAKRYENAKVTAMTKLKMSIKMRNVNYIIWKQFSFLAADTWVSMMLSFAFSRALFLDKHL